MAYHNLYTDQHILKEMNALDVIITDTEERINNLIIYSLYIPVFFAICHYLLSVYYQAPSYLGHTYSILFGPLMLFHGPQLLLCGPYYTVLSYCLIVLWILLLV